jgi:hypothetical protein
MVDGVPVSTDSNSFPEVPIPPEEGIREADERVRRAYSRRGIELSSYENLNTFFPTSTACHFYHAQLASRRVVVVVAVVAWTEDLAAAVLEVLLSLRVDPDPPGLPPVFQFHSAHPIPPVLATLFGQTPASNFECLALLAVGFGSNLLPQRAYQLAAMAMHLLRECLGVHTALDDPQGLEVIAEVVRRDFSAERFPEDGAPQNALLALGFLLGEMLRSRLAYTSRWVKLEDFASWPVLLFGPETAWTWESKGEKGPDSESGHGDAPQIVFNPILSVIALHQGSTPTLLADAVKSLEDKCEGVFAKLDEN